MGFAVPFARPVVVPLSDTPLPASDCPEALHYRLLMGVWTVSLPVDLH